MLKSITDTVNKLKTGCKGTGIAVIIAIAFIVTPPLIWTVTQVSGQLSAPDIIAMDEPSPATPAQVAIIDDDVCDTGCCECTGGKCTW